MKQLMLRQFYKPLPFSKLLREAALYETRKGQDLSEYCFNKLERLRALKLDIPEAYLVDAIIGGITDENIARTTRSSRFTDTNELYAYLSTIGHLPGSRPVKSAPTPQYATPGTSTEKSLKMGMECYNCKGPHRARDCPKPRAECFNYKQRGHFQSKCPFKRRPNDDSRKVTGDRGVNEVVQEDKETRNPYIMSVVLKGRKFKCLVDTGSSCTIIRRGVAEKLKLKIDEDKSVLRDFAGKVTTSAGSSKLHVRVGQPSATVRVVIMNDDHLLHDCVIGHDFINLPHVMLLKVGSEVFVRELSEIKPSNELECCTASNDARPGITYGDVPEEYREKCARLLSEFGDRVSTSMADLGKTDAAQLEIKCVTECHRRKSKYCKVF
jgi:hypothetical protein